MDSSDPTDSALAAIASIRDNAEDEVALQPQSEAEKHAIAVIEDKPLAQALFKAADVGDFVPPNLFKAVAEVLAYVYRLGRKEHSFGI